MHEKTERTVLSPSAHGVCTHTRPAQRARSPHDKTHEATAKKQLQETPQEVTETKTVRTPIKSGRWIFIDQATGKPSYTTEGPESVELPDDLANAFSKSSEGLKMVTMPDGSMMVDLSKRFQHASFVGINSEGKAVTSCLAPGGAHNTACAHNSDVSSTEKAGEENK